MPRRKQYYPRKHDGGTNSEMGEQTTAPADQQEPDLPLDCSKSSKASSPCDQISTADESIDTTENENTDAALDLSTRKRPRSGSSNQSASDLSIKRANVAASPKLPTAVQTDKDAPAFSPQLQSLPLLNFAPDGFLSSALSATSQAGNPYAPLLVPPFRFPPFPMTCPSMTSPPTSSAASQSQNGESIADSLSKLSSLVHQVGKGHKPASLIIGGSTDSKTPIDQPLANSDEGGSLQEALGAAAGHGLSFQELWLRFVKKEENAELKRLNEAKQIFTCLQCHASFQTMEQLVKHMEATQHYANIPKHYSWSLQYARQRMRQMKMKMKYSDKMMYYCFLCSAPFSEPVHIHFNCAHNMHNPVENMKFVHVISVNGKSTGRTPSSTSSSSVPGRPPGTTPATPPSANGDHRRRRPSNDDDIRFSSSPLSVGASSCDSGSVSPSPSTSSKRSTTTCPGTTFSPPTMTADSKSLANNGGSYTDNLLLKMEKLVQTAVGDKVQQKRHLNSETSEPDVCG